MTEESNGVQSEMSVFDRLMEMGFNEDKIKEAIQATGGQDVEKAMQWIVEDSEKKDSSEEANTKTEESAEEALSIECQDCGKLFTNQQVLMLHAEKTGHANFAESTKQPKILTEEEKRQKMADLQERLRIVREKKDEQERREKIAAEKSRRLAGREIADYRQKFQEEEMKKAAAERKRQKNLDVLAKKKVLDQIKADRQARKGTHDSAAMIETEVKAPPSDSSLSGSSTTEGTENKSSKIDVPSSCHLQIRQLNGKSLLQDFSNVETLAAVRLYIQLNRTDGCTESDPFRLMTTFPRRVFTEEDMQTPLAQLGLAPSAVLIMTK